MNRRNFIRNGSLAGLAFPAAAAASVSTRGIPTAITDSFDVNEATIDDLQKRMQSGELTSTAITHAYLKRIHEIDKTLNAVIEINPDALSIARMLDAERKAGKIKGPLHGIPVLVKDNIDTGDRMMTTAGSLALLGHKAGEDAFIIKKLRAAGAVILGKTNLSEWANFRASYSISGWSSRGGLTKNACMPDRNPSGSSSGSGAAVAANLCTVAIGTETDGSIISPSSHNGIVGIKPTVGLLSRGGIIPISKTQDTAGPMARTVRDAAILLSALTGIDDADAVTKESRTEKDYTAFLHDGGLSGKRIGVEKSHFSGRPAVVALYKEAIELMRSKGAVIIEVDLLNAYRKLDYKEYLVLKYEFKDGINKYLSKAKAQVTSLADVIAFNAAHAEKMMPYFKQETLESSEKLGDLSSKEYLDALSKRSKVQEMINDLMHENTLHAICGTSMGLPGLIDVINGDYDTGFYFCPPAAVAGYPHITVPMGKYRGLPAGLSFMSGAWMEPELLTIAYAYEQASKKREAPKFLKPDLP